MTIKKIIYLHGFDSSPNSKKANQLREYLQKHHSQYELWVPDCNLPPKKLIEKIQPEINKNTLLIGSSLGGFYAIILNALTQCPIIALNPAVYPHLLFKKRFFSENFDLLPNDYLVKETQYGLVVTKQMILDLEELSLLAIKYPKSALLIANKGDELLDYQIMENFFENADQLILEGGNHAMDNFSNCLNFIFDWINQH